MDLPTFQFLQELARTLDEMESNYFGPQNDKLTDSENPFQLLPRIFPGGKVPAMSRAFLDALAAMLASIANMRVLSAADAFTIGTATDTLEFIDANFSA